jgi:hypothetical protein
MSATDSMPETQDMLSPADSRATAQGSRFFCVIPNDDVSAERNTTPWWLWWNILSLDAPTVAAVWALLLARASHMRLRAADEIVLSLVVWCIYISDRLFDGLRQGNRKEVLHERHLFCAKHRRALTWLLVLAAAAALWVTAGFLTRMEVTAGMKLAAIIGTYMASIHACHGSMARFVPKEVAVGILFAAGTTLPVWSRASQFSWDVWALFGLFAVLCFLNCFAIDCWEKGGCAYDWFRRNSPVVGRAETRVNQIAAALAASTFAVMFARRDNGLFGSGLAAICLAALLICVLNRHRNRLPVQALRVLADATLVVVGVLALAGGLL